MGRAVFPHIGLLAVMLVIQALSAFNAGAEGINFNAEEQYQKSTGTTKLKTTGQSFDTDFDRYYQRYNLDVSKNIYPYLIFSSGSVYELNNLSTKTGDTTVDTEERRLTPYAELDLNNPIYKAGVTVRKRRIDFSQTDLPDTQTDRDEFTANLGMTPPEWFPYWNLRYSRFHTYDDPETQDQIQKLLMLDTAWTPWDNLNLNYNYTRTDTEEKLLNFDTLQQTQFGRINYGNNFFDDRLALDAGYTINYNSFEFTSHTGSSESPLLRTAGLSSLNNTPADGPPLSVNDALIDGNVIASAGLNIGTAGDQTQLVNIGLDLGFAVDVDQIYIWVDRRLSTAVAASFSWSVYTSPDNTAFSTWTLAATIFPAQFGTFDNRFEIVFPTVNTRFIKVVVRPLSPVVPGATDFTNIFVTEMQALITVSGTSLSRDTSELDQNVNFNLRGRLTDQTTVGYNLLYNRQTTDPLNTKRTQLTNGLFVNQIFNNVFSANVNGQRTDNSLPEENFVNYTYGASVRANWLNTFNQSLTYSGILDESDLGRSYQNSVFLRNNATLYRGWSAFLDLGYTWEEPVAGSRTNSIIIRPGTSIQPHKTLTLNMDYQYKRTEESGGDIGPTTETKWDLQAFYVPFSTLSFFAKLNAITTDGSTDLYQNYSVNWSPFPDGDLQFSFVFSEILVSEANQEDRVVGPSLKWNISRHFVLDMSYNFTTSDSDIQRVESNIFDADLKVYF